MNYTLLTLTACGLFGVLIHNLVKLNEINKASDGNINLGKYWKVERFAILLSCCVVAAAIIVRNEVRQLEQVGKWLGFGFIAIGYMAQSVIVSLMGRAQKIIGSSDEDKKP